MYSTFFLLITYAVQRKHSQRTHSHPYETHARKPYLWRMDRQILEIDEVTTGTTLSTVMSSTYHWKHNTIKLYKIRFHEKSNI
jgi:hypothetical protein